MAAPGVVVTTATRSGPTGVTNAPSGQYFAVGLAERGPTDQAAKVTSLGEYQRLFGQRVAYGALYDDLAAFFECGGRTAWVLRVAGPAAAVGTLTVSDSAVASPMATIRVDAANPGAWSSRVTVEVAAGSTSGTRRVAVRLDGQVVEQYNNLGTVADIVARFAKSPYVRVTNLGSTAAPADVLPKVTAPTPLSSGNDDRASVNAAQIAAKLPLFKVGYGDGAVGAPGYGPTMHAALIEHARTHRRVAVLTGAKGNSVSDLATLGLGLESVPGTQYAGLFGPWIQVSDGAGGVRTISPEGFVAAARAKAHEQVGPWAAAAGELSVTPYIVGTDVEVSRADHDVLDAARVSPIRVVANKLRLYGWRSLSIDEREYGSLTVGDTLNRLVTECEARLEPFVFQTVDGRGRLFAEMKGILIGVLEPIRAAGGLFEWTNEDGEPVDLGYSVSVDREVNTVESLSRNEVRANVAVRLTPNASTINLTITKAGLTAAV